MHLSVIIVNYNVKAFLQQSLESLQRALRGLEAEIIVVDNHSVDGSVAMLRDKFPDIRLIANHENLGFAKANNQALELAKGRYLWLLNPDTLVQEDTAQNLIQVMEDHPDTGLLGCKILNDDGSLQLACRRSFPTPWVAFTKLTGLARLFPKSRLFGRYNLTYLDPAEDAVVEAISGSCMFARREALEQVGPLDETFFMYGEDLDWCYRFRAADWQVRYTARTSIIHYKGESAKHSSWGSLANFYKAMDIFARKHFRSSLNLPLHWILRAGIVARYLVSALGSLGKNVSSRLLDVLGLGLLTLLAIYIKFGTLEVLGAYQLVLPIYLLIWYTALASFGLYRTFRYSISRALLAVSLGFLINVTLTYFFKEYAFSRMVMLMSYAGALVWVPAWRILAAKRRRENYAVATEKVLIIGDQGPATDLYSRLVTDVDLGYDPVGIVAEKGQAWNDKAVVGEIPDLLDLVRIHEVHQVIFASDQLSIKRVFAMIPDLNHMGIKIKLVPGNLAFIIGKSSVENLQDVQFIDMDYRFFYPLNRFLKRLVDIFLSTFLLLLVRPVTALIASIRGVELRTVILNGRSLNRYDSQGSWSSLRENLPLLPQVLLGRMSLVGAPLTLENRPEKVPAGLTSLEDLRQTRPLSEDERLALLNYYLHNQSVLLDLEILIKTMMGR